MFRVQMLLDGLAAIPKSVRREAFRAAIGKAGEYWHKHFMPFHFTNQAYARYSYAQRKPGYERAKRMRRENGQGVKAIGEVKPLVWSGTSRERAKHRDVRPKAASAERFYADVLLHAPALNFRNPKSRTHPRVEVTYVNESERNRLQGVFQTEAARELQRRGATQKVIRVYR